MPTQTQPHPKNTQNSRGRRGKGQNRRGGANKSSGAAQRAVAETDAEPAQLEDAVKKDEVEESEVAGNLCWICASDLKYYAFSACNHQTCHVCALRLRALYKKTDCTFCKTSQPEVVISISGDRQFEDFDRENSKFKDVKLGIVFETQEMMEECLVLLRFNCPDLSCDYIASGWSDLKAHCRSTHSMFLCDLCLRNKKIFAHEHILYPPSQLAIHLPTARGFAPKATAADGPPEGGVHPICQFCKEAMYGDDEHFSHMRERHEECFLCKRAGIQHQYFRDYKNLEKHFTDAHHPCPQGDCLAQKFVVFATPIDLQAHMVEVHGNNMSAQDLKNARRVQADFAFEDVGRRPGRNREREQQEARERSRERELQRQRDAAEQSAQARRRQAFSGLLSGPSNTTPQAQSQAATPSLGAEPEDLDPQTRERHAAFMARVSSVTDNAPNVIALVKFTVRAYRASETSANDVVDTFYNAFGERLETTGSILSSLADLLDNEEKKSELMKSWNEFKIQHREQFPAIVPTGTGTQYAGVTGGRLLNIKHQTKATRSSRQVLDRVERAATSSGLTPRPALGATGRPVPGSLAAASSTSAFPSLSDSAGIPSTSRGGLSSTAWSAAGGSSRAAAVVPSSKIVVVPSVSKPSTSSGGSVSRPPALSGAAFPGLPPTNATKVPKGAISGNVSLRNIVGDTAPPTIAWKPTSGSAGNSGTSTPQHQQSNEEGDLKGKGKKGKGKEVLFNIGMRR